ICPHPQVHLFLPSPLRLSYFALVLMIRWPPCAERDLPTGITTFLRVFPKILGSLDPIPDDSTTVSHPITMEWNFV
ncbi:MAG: hypothetical protein MK212_20930, partial [Saprospiraceae bacterium]|nr:hypothetical protein [Saprospiraceae bacterium]